MQRAGSRPTGSRSMYHTHTHTHRKSIMNYGWAPVTDTLQSLAMWLHTTAQTEWVTGTGRSDQSLIWLMHYRQFVDVLNVWLVSFHVSLLPFCIIFQIVIHFVIVFLLILLHLFVFSLFILHVFVFGCLFAQSSQSLCWLFQISSLIIDILCIINEHKHMSQYQIHRI